jgi:hypothetical protein
VAGVFSIHTLYYVKRLYWAKWVDGRMYYPHVQSVKKRILLSSSRVVD